MLKDLIDRDLISQGSQGSQGCVDIVVDGSVRSVFYRKINGFIAIIKAKGQSINIINFPDSDMGNLMRELAALLYEKKK